MKNVISLSAIFLAIAALNFACAPTSGGGSQNSPVSPAGTGPVAEGTVSGGGGNGCGGEVFEGKAKSITEFAEYQLYIRPLLRRMAEQGSDPLVTYLRWVAEDKAWFFVPCALRPLSSEQLGIAVDSDQMARHIEHSIYVDSRPGVEKTYATQSLKARSATLLHEMVMGAFLLMKKSAKDQCQALAKRDASLCSDSQVMAIVEQPLSPDQKNPLVVDGVDRDRITAMTAFLGSKDADFSTANLKRMRERLGFHFPWDRANSDLSFADFVRAVARSQQMGDRYKAVGGSRYLRENPSTCSIGVSNRSGVVGFEIGFALPFRPSDVSLIQDLLKKYSLRQFDQVCMDGSESIHERWVRNGNYMSEPECKGDRGWKWGYYMERFFADVRPDMNVRGVLRDGQVYDEVTVFSSSQGVSSYWGGREITSGIVRILVTREVAPRIHAIRFEPKQKLKLSPGAEIHETDELLDIPGVSPVECVRH